MIEFERFDGNKPTTDKEKLIAELDGYLRECTCIFVENKADKIKESGEMSVLISGVCSYFYHMVEFLCGSVDGKEERKQFKKAIKNIVNGYLSKI